MLYVAIILFALVCAGLAVLAIENLQTEVQLSLIAWQPQVSLGLLLLLAFVLGAAVLYLLAAASAWQDTRELKRLRLRVAGLEQEAKNVSTDPLPGVTPIVPMPGMPPNTDISDMTTQH
jgi:uncharacterized integral membrane protein